MNPALILCEWFLCRIGEARADELVREDRRAARMARLYGRLARAEKRHGKPRRRRPRQPAPPEIQKIHEDFKAKGWTLRPAAKELGVAFSHLSNVLNGNRPSRRLLTAVAALPHRKAS